MDLHAGYFQVDISPSLDRPVYLAGFGQNRPAESIADPLTARALALSTGTETLVLAALDLIGLARMHCQEIAGLVNVHRPGVRVIIACTHTHHGPDTLGLWGPDMATSGVNREYLSSLKMQVAAACLEACKRLQPARLCAADVHVPGVVKNARDPLILDSELTCLQFQYPDASALANLFIFPCHPEVLWEHNPAITSDYPGYLRRAVEAGTGAPCLFFAGALGGMLTPDVIMHSFTEAEHLGKVLAQAGLRRLTEKSCSTPVESPALQITQASFPIPLTNPLFRLAMSAGLLPTALDESDCVHTEVNLLKIGSTWLATVPGELLPKLGLEIKHQLREAGAEVAAVIGLANDELGYILPVEDFIYPADPFEPGSHYEETMSIGPEAGPRLMQAVQELILISR